MTLDELRLRLEGMLAEKRSPSEVDTQVLLVEPVLALAGWGVEQISEVRRASHDSGDPFDIEAWYAGVLRLAVDVKSLKSAEFRVQPGIDGAINPWRDKRDGTGQLRFYCSRHLDFIIGKTLPVLTNGQEWVLFDKTTFIDRSRRDQPPITVSDITVRRSLGDQDFEQEIVARLRNARGNDKD